MVVAALARWAAAVTVARALSLETHALAGSSSLKSDLPRTVLQAHSEDGCGRNLTGYIVTGAGMVWSDASRGNAASVMDCRQKCDLARNCVGFTARYPRSGQMQCSLYKGLVTKYDPRAMSYLKCAHGFKCSNSEGLTGFQFSHQGTWKNGVRVDFKSTQKCSARCLQDRSCVGFTKRHTKSGKSECYHFTNAANGHGPLRDSRATTYSKCVALENATDASTPRLPLNMAIMPKSEASPCSSGYAPSSKGWWWHKYDRLSEVTDMQACASKCDSHQTCVSFIYRPFAGQAKAECYLYSGVTAHFNSSMVAFTRCRQGLSCKKTSEPMFRGYQFSHYGTWEGGTKVEGVAMRSCSLICQSDEACSAVSWKKEGEVCTKFDFKASDAPRLADGAEGYAKCMNVEVDKTQALI